MMAGSDEPRTSRSDSARAGRQPAQPRYPDADDGEPGGPLAADPSPRRARVARPAPSDSAVASTVPAGGRKPNPGRNLPQAIAVGVGMAAAVLVSLLVRKEAFVALIAAAVVVGVWELSHALVHRKLHIPVIPLAVGSVGMLVSAFVARGEGLFAALLLTSFGVLLWRLIDGVQGAARDVAAGVFAAVYVPFLAGWAMIMLADRTVPERVIVYVATVVASDIGGYTAGVLFGRHPMAPSDQPEEVVGGIRRLGAGVLPGLLGGGDAAAARPVWAGAVLGPVVAVTATAGDLCESLSSVTSGSRTWAACCPATAASWTGSTRCCFSAPVGLPAVAAACVLDADRRPRSPSRSPPRAAAKPPRHLADLDLADARHGGRGAGREGISCQAALGALLRALLRRLAGRAEDDRPARRGPAAAGHRACCPTLLTPARQLDCDSGRTVKTAVAALRRAVGRERADALPGRVTVCVSSQAGCGMACPFCATGQAGLTRNLSAGRDRRAGGGREPGARGRAGRRAVTHGRRPGLQRRVHGHG